MAIIFPPLWLVQNRLWEVMIAVFLIYGTTLAVHWVLFVIASIALSLYFRKAHLVLRRSFAMMRGRHMWLVVAEKSELETQRLCRQMDPKCVFVPDLVGPPVVDEVVERIGLRWYPAIQRLTYRTRDPAFGLTRRSLSG